MPTPFQDEFWILDPFSPPPVGTLLTPQFLTVTDENDNNFVSQNGGDSVSGLNGNPAAIDITQVYNGDTVTVELSDGSGQLTVTGVTLYLANGVQIFSPTDGSKLDPGTFVSSTFVTGQGAITVPSFGPPCFTPGTLIDTAAGPRAVETLRPGDLVRTADHGLQPIRWAGRRVVQGTGALAPVRIMAGALGNTRAIEVSPQHRMLLTGWRAEMATGAPEVLAAAKHLINGDTIVQVPRRDVTYIHLLFDRHEIIFAEGIPTESFLPGAQTLACGAEAHAEIVAIFPELADLETGAWPAARPILKAHEAAGVAEVR
ncbi:MAG: Hint domain-containing protein [Pseudomonadota bacterium]